MFVLVLLTSSAPTAAQSANGTPVLEHDSDATPALDKGTLAIVCFIDHNDSGSPDAGDAVYVLPRETCQPLPHNTVRLTPSGGQQPGTLVRSIHSDFNEPTVALATFVAAPTATGLVYLDMDASTTVTTGDLRLSVTQTYPAGSFVTVNDADRGLVLGVALGSAAEIFGTLDLDGDDVLSAGDLAILDVDRDGHASPGDVALARAPYLFGEHVHADAERARVRLGPTAFRAVCQTGQGIIVATRSSNGCAGSIATHDLVLSGSRAGHRVQTGDAEQGNALQALNVRWRFVDTDGDTRLDAGDALYLVFSTTRETIGTGDLRLTYTSEEAAGERVAANDADHGATAIDAHVVLSSLRLYRPSAAPAVHEDSRIVLDVDGDGVLTVGDVTLSGDSFGHWTTLFGAPVTLGGPQTPFVALCAIDSDGNGNASVGEPVLAVQARESSEPCDATRAGDLWVYHEGTSRAGRFLESDDADTGQPLVPFQASTRYYDADGDGTTSLGDTYYLVRGDGTAVQPGDIRLSPFGSGEAATRVVGGDSDVNNGLAVSVGLDVTEWQAFNTDGDPDVGTWDLVYLAQTTRAGPAYGDLRLTYRTVPSYGMTNVDPEPQPWETTTTTTTTTPPPTTTTTTPPTPPPTTTTTPPPDDPPPETTPPSTDDGTPTATPTDPTPTPSAETTSDADDDDPKSTPPAAGDQDLQAGGASRDPDDADGNATAPSSSRFQSLALVALAALVAAGGTAALVTRRRAQQASAAPTTVATNGTTTPMVDVRNVRVSYGKTPVLAAVSLRAMKGTVNLVLGRSGSGKSTLIRALVGLTPYQGTIRVGQKDGIRPEDFGYVPQRLELPTNLTALDACALFGRAYGVPAKTARERGKHLLAQLDMEGKERERLDRLSGGQQRRVSIAVALVHEPRLLILDEPTSGLDFAARKGLWVLLQDLAHRQGITLVASTHFLDDVDYADQVSILDQGRIVATGTVDHLVRSIPGEGRCLEVEYEEKDLDTRRRAEAALQALLERKVLVRYDVRPFVARCYTSDPTRAMPVVQGALREAAVNVRGVRVADVRIDDVFLVATGHGFE